MAGGSPLPGGDAAPGAGATPAPGASACAAAERLAAYDAFARDVRSELGDVTARMDDLKARGKVKTATYRQLFATRLTLREIDGRLAARGL